MEIFTINFMPNVLGVHISKTSKEKVIRNIEKSIVQNCPYTIFTPNPEILLLASKQEDYKDILNSSDCSVPDGIGVYIGYKIQDSKLWRPLKYWMLPLWTISSFLGKNTLAIKYGEKITGSDLTKKILTLGQKNKKDVVVLDNKVEGIFCDFDKRKKKTQEKLKNTLEKLYPGIQAHIYFWNTQKHSDIKRAMQELDYPIVISALGMKKQEKSIQDLSRNVDISTAIGAGGSIDMLVGLRNEPPTWIRNMGFEWFFRIFQRPKVQIQRIGNVVLFAITCIKQTK